MHQEEIKGKQKLINSLNNFLLKNSKILIIILILLIITIISIAVTGTYKSGKNEESALAIEKIQTEYSELQSEKNGELSDDDINSIITSLDSVIEKFPSYYAEQRALFMKGDVYFTQKNYEKAFESFKAYSDKYTDTYLSPIALFNSGVCSEELDNLTQAIDIYESLLKKYRKSYPDIPGIIFSIARLYETTENYVKAHENYTELVDNYKNSGWTNFARDRIIYLKASDLIK